MQISVGNADGNSVKKYGISNQPDVCIFDDPCLSKFGTIRGSGPPIVSGVPDMHPSDSQNVEETRNLMQTSNW